VYVTSREKETAYLSSLSLSLSLFLPLEIEKYRDANEERPAVF